MCTSPSSVYVGIGYLLTVSPVVEYSWGREGDHVSWGECLSTSKRDIQKVLIYEEVCVWRWCTFFFLPRVKTRLFSSVHRRRRDSWVKKRIVLLSRKEVIRSFLTISGGVFTPLVVSHKSPLLSFSLRRSADTLPPREVLGRQYAVYTKHIGEISSISFSPTSLLGHMYSLLQGAR